MSTILELTSTVVASYVRRHRVNTDELPQIIASVARSLLACVEERAPVVEEVVRDPFVPVKKSIQPDYLVCLEDGKKLKMLKRYLRSHFGLSPDEYRRKWGLPHDYPMVAPNYSVERSRFAKSIGLGRGGRPPAAQSAVGD